MAIDRTYFCENPSCADGKPGESDQPASATTATPPPYLPRQIIETRQVDDDGETLHHFCSWDCLMKFAAAQPVPEIVPLDDGWADTGGEDSDV